MIRSHHRRLVPCLQALLTLAAAFGVAHCGGGELPPPANDDFVPDAGPGQTSDAGTQSGITFPDVDLEKGITFGDNGFTDCGGQAAPQTITLKNSLNEIVNYTASFTAGNVLYAVSPPTGGVPARGTALLQITPAAIPKESDVRADLYASTLEVKFPGRGTPTQIRLHQTARGAIISLTGGPTLDLGSVKVGDTASIPLSITNSGNAEVTASLGLGTSVFTIGGGPTASIALPPGKTESRPLALKPTSAGDLNDTLALSFNTAAVMCKAVAANPVVKGKGTTSVGVSPGLLDFGDVNCGATAPSQPLTISSTIAMTFAVALDKGGASSFRLTDEAGTTVPQGAQNAVAAASSFKLFVVPKPIPPSSPITPDFYSDSLKITTNVPGDPEKTIPVKMGAKGAILAFSPANGITVNAPDINATGTTAFSIINTGNVQIPYTLTVVNTNGSTYSGPVGAFGINGAAVLTSSGNANIGNTALQLNTKAPATYSTTTEAAINLAVTTTGPTGQAICGDLPGSYSIKTATAAGTSITLTPPALQFGEVLCGKTDTPPQTVTLNSVVTTNFTPDLVKGANSPFTLKNSTGTDIVLGQPINVTAGTPFVITVVPKPMPARPLIGTIDNGFGDTMTIKSPVEATKNYEIRQTAKGAILRWSTTLFTAGKAAVPPNPPTTPGSPAVAPSPSTFNLINDGNLTAEYTITNSGAYSTNIPTGSAPKGSTPGVLTGTGDSQMKVTTTTVLCADLPGNAIIGDGCVGDVVGQPPCPVF